MVCLCGGNFSKTIETKMEEKFFFIPQITELFEEQDFSTKLKSRERRVWKALENFCRNFLDGKKERKISMNFCKS